MVTIPNWCSNTLTVTGTDEELDRFSEAAKSDDTALSLEKLYPTPKPPEDADEKDIMPFWWTWRVVNWGTKWDLEATVFDPDDNTLVYEFDSAWAPPSEAFEKISANFPTLHFRLEYDEPGMDFWGVDEFMGGAGGTVDYGSSQLNQLYAEEEDGLVMLGAEEDLPDD